MGADAAVKAWPSTLAVVGVGLIGGSFALAMRRAGFTGRIIGVSSPATIEKALRLRVIEEALPLADAAAQADLIYLSQPIFQILKTIESIDACVPPGTLITDAGSTKGAICAAAAKAIRRGRFVGGHPMAGKESRGVEEAEASLFEGRPYVVTGGDGCELLEPWIEKIGARLVRLDAEEHDRLVAIASHVPQLMSTALAAAIGEAGAEQVAGPGAIDMTRLALSSYGLWGDILQTNAASIDAALSVVIARLQQLQRELNSPATERAFEQGAAAARALRKE